MAETLVFAQKHLETFEVESDGFRGDTIREVIEGRVGAKGVKHSNMEPSGSIYFVGVKKS